MKDLDELDKILLPTAESIAGEWGDAEMGKDALRYVNNLKAQLNQYVSQRLVEALKEILDTQLPWPTDVFGEVPETDWPKINAFATKELDYPIDRISATLMRRGWKCLERQIKNYISDLEATVQEGNHEES